MESVVLFTLTNEEIKISIDAYFDATGNLVIDGYDRGKKVEAYWGDFDYEYTTTISPEEVNKLYVLLDLVEGNKSELLLALQKRFNTNTCYSELQNYLDQNNIKYEGFSWA